MIRRMITSKTNILASSQNSSLRGTKEHQDVGTPTPHSGSDEKTDLRGKYELQD